MKAHQITEDRLCHHGEGPMWDVRRGRLLLVDMLAGDVLGLTPDGDGHDVTRHSVHDKVAAVVRPRASGGYVVAVERGFALLDDDLGIVEELPPVIDTDTLRLNEGGCDPHGTFWCGSMAYGATPGAGSLYRLGVDHRVDVGLTGVTISNGLQWSADGTRAFYVDTPLGRIDEFAVDPTTGNFGERRVFTTVEPPGRPDGMAIDAEGGLWVALWGGHGVRRYDQDGNLSEVVELPVPNVTACAFGGDDLRTLYVTTSRQGDPDAPDAAGAVFAVEPGVTGVPLHPYRG